MNIKPGQSFLHDGESINYSIEGNGKIPIVFLHGFSLSTYSWKRLTPHLNASDYKFIFIDLKGAGFSAKPRRSDYSIKKQSELVIALINNLNIDSFSIVAHSYGGLVALYLNYLNEANQYNLNIKKLVLLDTQAFNEKQPFFIRALRSKILSFIGLKFTSAKSLAKRTIKNTYFNPEIGIKHFVNIYSYFYKMKGHDEAMIQLAKQVVPNDFKNVIESYGLIDFPVLIIWGENDELIDSYLGKRLSESIAESKLIVLTECGHVPHEERPIQTSSIINEFLK